MQTGSSVELPPALRGHLLDPAVWQEGLEKYARATSLAVALTDAGGSLLGGCINPRPTWALFRDGKPCAAGECPFAVLPEHPCRCVADALASGSCCLARDRTGLVHFAVPLTLGEHRLGALVAGQVFDQYPEQLALEHAARQSGLRLLDVWQQARLEHPVKQATLRVYADLLATLGSTSLQTRYHNLREAGRLEELRRAQEQLRAANDELERRVEQRTAAWKQAQEQALQAARLAAIGQTVTVLAHEGRNVLQRALGCLERLGWRLKDRPEALDLAGRAQQALHDLERLFDDLRAYGATVRLDRAECCVAWVWRQAWEQATAPQQGRDARLEEQTAGCDPSCAVDALRLAQVFRNLFENCLEACADPVRVTICCRDAELGGQPALQIAVRDNGPGLDPRQRQRIFEPFYTTKAVGTGLGLAICKRLVEAHGGTIEAGQAGPGAQIILTLPRRA
jgi:signal transduction histidine kinase